MTIPALQNQTLRLLILVAAVCGAIAATAGIVGFSYMQTRAAGIQAMEEMTGLWADATRRMMADLKNQFQSVDHAGGERSLTQMSSALRRLVIDSTILREAWIVEDGRLVCTDVGVAEDPRPPDYGPPSVPAVGDIVLFSGAPGGDGSRAIGTAFNAGGGRIYGAFIPPRAIAERMRVADEKSGHAVFFADSDGTVLDQSVTASTSLAKDAVHAAPGLTETAENLIFSRSVPGTDKVVIAVLPKQQLVAMWGRGLPLYAGLSLVFIGCILVAARMVRAQTLSLEAELREAVRLRQIVAHYQPILDLRDDRCSGFEVLMRWQHPTRGLVPPLAFVPEAERTGLITALTECMMVRALDELTPVFEKFPHLHAAINVPVQTLTNPTFPAHVDRLIRNRFSYSNISFELTESTSLDNSALQQLHATRDLGIRFAVDDFGTGYSNLRYLSAFPFEFLKIDKAFVDGISGEGKSSGLVDHIVTIGKACGMKLIAEGVEHEWQAWYLRSLGVEFGQGYFFAKPMTATELMAWLQGETPRAKGTA